ncbi:MAG: carboxymuconolactone decarboxylase family protein [Edaphobacter sp.]
MPHIPLPENAPGPRGPMLFRPQVAQPMSEMAEVLMRGPSSLTLVERELIGTYVSAENDCLYCQSIHGAVAAHYLGGGETNEALVHRIKCDPSTAPIDPKLKALLKIAGHVQQGGKHVTTGDIAEARAEGATDLEIHDTVLIAANFCMMNRYVDGLAAWTPEDPDFYRQRAANLAEHGYAGSASRS